MISFIKRLVHRTPIAMQLTDAQIHTLVDDIGIKVIEHYQSEWQEFLGHLTNQCSYNDLKTNVFKTMLADMSNRINRMDYAVTMVQNEIPIIREQAKAVNLPDLLDAIKGLIK